MSVALICVPHDPEGKNLNLLRDASPLINEIYADLFITVSDETDDSVCSELQRSNFKTKIIPKNGAAQARREALKFGLSGDNLYFHYCDLDRLLTWLDRYSDELRVIVREIPRYNYLILGRTAESFNTHPVKWTETEKISNKIFSLELG
jgi:hypothetical protein